MSSAASTGVPDGVPAASLCSHVRAYVRAGEPTMCRVRAGVPDSESPLHSLRAAVPTMCPVRAGVPDSESPLHSLRAGVPCSVRPALPSSLCAVMPGGRRGGLCPSQRTDSSACEGPRRSEGRHALPSGSPTQHQRPGSNADERAYLDNDQGRASHSDTLTRPTSR